MSDDDPPRCARVLDEPPAGEYASWEDVVEVSFLLPADHTLTKFAEADQGALLVTDVSMAVQPTAVPAGIDP